MKRSFIRYLIGWLTSYSIAFAQTHNNPQLSNQFDKLLAEQFKANGPGCTALVARQGKIIYQKAFGLANLELKVPMQSEMVLRIGSITKQFTAIAILQLMEQHKLSLQDPITRFIPDYPTQGKTITIEHLLTHTSGIKNFLDLKEFSIIARKDLTPTQLIDFFKNQPMDFEPGTKWQYSNSGYILLGYIIEMLSGKPYPQYLQDVIFKPLGMHNSYCTSNTKLIRNQVAGYQASNEGPQNADYLSTAISYAAGSIQSTVGDLWRWHQAVRAGKLVNKETLRRAWSPYKLSDGKPTYYGYGWVLDTLEGSPTIEHGGGLYGFLTDAVYLPQEDVFVAVFSNSTANSPDDITNLLAVTAAGKAKKYREIILNPTVLGEYVGVYENEAGEQRIVTLTEHQLFWPGRASPSKLKAYQKDQFIMTNSLATLRFVRNNLGQVESIRYRNRFGESTWRKINRVVPSGK